jgi:hypothetical protein
MMNLEHLNSMDGYTFDEGIAFLVLVKAPLGVINHLKATHNRSHLHSEIHKQLRFPRVKEIVRHNMGNSPQISSNFPIANEPKSNEIEPKSNEIAPKSNEIKPNSNDDEPDSDETDPTEIILTKEDVRTHENTRLEDMPNDLCRNLWQKRQDVYREMQQAHLKMRAVPEGEEHNEERAKWRAEVLRLDAENDKYWQQIDAEIERFNAEKERADEKADKEDQAGFNVSTYRAYICKAIRKKELSPVQFAELQHRVNAMLAAGVEMDPETIEKLKAKGITVD